MGADEEKIAATLKRVTSRARGVTDRNNCPDEETLAAFLNAALAMEACSRIEAHLSHCSFCVDDLVAAHKGAQSEDLENIPRRLIESALALIPGRKTLFDLTVRLVRGSIELIETSARVIPAPVAVLRGEALPAQGNMLQVEQEVGRFRVSVELDLTEAGTCQVVADVREPSGEPAEGVRLSLSSGEREQASFLTRHGVVVFDRIAPGEYSIAVSEAGTHVGRIKLNLMLEK
jgi:hypothetical protein